MPQNLNALQSLLRSKSSSNMSAGADPYVVKRRAQMATGLDDMVPNADGVRVKLAQEKLGGGFSRDAIRDDMFSELQNVLGQKEIAHQQEMEEAEVPQRIAGEFDIRKQNIASQGNERVARINADQRVSTAEANASAREASVADMLQAWRESGGNRALGVAGVGSMGAPPKAVAGVRGNVPANFYDAITKAEDKQSGKLMTMLGGGGGARDQLKSALTNYLDRSGTLQDVDDPKLAAKLAGAQGNTIDERITNSGDPALQQLDVYERKYLKLKLGL